MTAYAATGHRPPRLGLGYTPGDRKKLRDFALSVLQGLEDAPSLLITGGAQGWDQAVAHACWDLHIPFLVAVPFEGQERRWPTDARAYYGRILLRAQEVVVVSPGSSSKRAYIVRDHYMVDRADKVLALYDGERKGGTYETVLYAGEQEKSVVNVWEEWVRGR